MTDHILSVRASLTDDIFEININSINVDMQSYTHPVILYDSMESYILLKHQYLIGERRINKENYYIFKTQPSMLLLKKRIVKIMKKESKYMVEEFSFFVNKYYYLVKFDLTYGRHNISTYYDMEIVLDQFKSIPEINEYGTLIYELAQIYENFDDLKKLLNQVFIEDIGNIIFEYFTKNEK